jgi:hypothetical protein
VEKWGSNPALLVVKNGFDIESFTLYWTTRNLTQKGTWMRYRKHPFGHTTGHHVLCKKKTTGRHMLVQSVPNFKNGIWCRCMFTFELPGTTHLMWSYLCRALQQHQIRRHDSHTTCLEFLASTDTILSRVRNLYNPEITGVSYNICRVRIHTHTLVHGIHPCYNISERVTVISSTSSWYNV